MDRNMLELFGPAAKVQAVSYKEWIEREHFTNARKRENWKAARDLENGSYSFDKQRRYDSFLKVQTQSVTVVETGTVGDSGSFKHFDPRVIECARPVHRVAVGPSILGIQEHISDFLCWPKFTPQAAVLGCHLTQGTLGDWFTYWTGLMGTNFIIDDFSRFDMTHSHFSLDLGLKVYRYFGLDDKRAIAFLKAQMSDVSGRTRLGYYFKRKDGMMASGVPNTTLGNSIVNLVTHCFFMSKAGYKLGRDFALAVMGDDMLMIWCGKTQPTFDFKSLGLKAKTRFETLVPNVEFCANQFYPVIVDGKRVYRPSPGLSTLFRMGWTIHDMPAKLTRAHARAVALGLQKPSRPNPLMSAVVLRTLELTENEPELSGYWKTMYDREWGFNRVFTGDEDMTPIMTQFLEHLNIRYGISGATTSKLFSDVAAVPGLGLFTTSAWNELAKRVLSRDG